MRSDNIYSPRGGWTTATRGARVRRRGGHQALRLPPEALRRHSGGSNLPTVLLREAELNWRRVPAVEGTRQWMNAGTRGQGPNPQHPTWTAGIGPPRETVCRPTKRGVHRGQPLGAAPTVHALDVVLFLQQCGGELPTPWLQSCRRTPKGREPPTGPTKGGALAGTAEAKAEARQ